ncbi:heme-binding protein [Mediterraneibacter sp. NSJ-55]|uniref:Heme-binding protein n=1 Tax=Mediterraneibacter hominis TaxID=2763054 RepID=A0A923LKE1_9FIRM|nr:heme-binding protein [Mediterraneibacter hominis]MBC5690430.1 heme-binding protein [Mediterraneibacter hominis]
MNEQDITRAVKAVLEEMEEKHSNQIGRHVCKCKKQEMTLNLANALIEKVKAYAKEIGVNVVIAVSDKAGRPVAVQCMDDAYIASFDIAINKTFTSASLKMSTEQLSHLSQPGQSLYGIQFTNGGKIVIFGGGEPLEADGKIIGALGVSGGTAQQDTKIAAYGRDVFKEVLACL